MATGNIKGGKRNYAKPTSPTTASAAYSGDDLQVTFTGSTLGPTPSSYLVAGTSNDGGTATSTTSSTSPAIINGASASKTYTFQVAGVNYNGTGVFGTATNAVTTAPAYVLDSTINSSGNYTIPSGKTSLMAVVVGAGADGGTPSSINGLSGPGGAGGSAGGIATIWNVSVTAGTTAAITIGTPGNSTILSYGGTDIATVTTANVGNNNAGQAGSGGTASTNIATNRVLTNGTAGPAGADRITPNATGLPGSAGTNINFTTANLGIGSASPSTPLTFTLSTGASGGSGGGQNTQNGSSAGGAGATGGTNGGNSGTGGTAAQSSTNPTAGNAAAGFGSGGGGGGGGQINTFWIGGNSAAGGAGGAGGSGRVYIFVK
jgi:hypothetical protein